VDFPQGRPQFIRRSFAGAIGSVAHFLARHGAARLESRKLPRDHPV